MNSVSMPKAVVLSCLGGNQGDISVVRTLGRQGIPVTVVSEGTEAISLLSRYCSESIPVDSIAADYGKTLEMLVSYAKKQDRKPVLFPTGDPDLKFVADLRDELADHYHVIATRKDLVADLMDKRRFFALAKTHGFPIPLTLLPQGPEDLRKVNEQMRYPAILKPSLPSAWTHDAVKGIVGDSKAMIVRSRDELISLYERIAVHSRDMIIQEFIGGRDDNHYDLHVYMDRNSEPVGCLTGRKIRVHPAYAGTGCFVESVYVKELADLGVEMLRKIAFTGLANFNFKRDPLTQEFKLLEINPRTSSWNILDAYCGVNLPYLAYADAAGIPFSAPGRQREQVKYVYLKSDVKAFLEYRKKGDWTLRSWLSSFRGEKVYQMYAADDLRPFVVDLTRTALNVMRRVVDGTPPPPETGRCSCAT
jgi:predicted ATP-grasp superfamily ATP-dependent carboligase